MKPLSTGGALALTVIAFYSLCTLVAVIWPEPFIGFMNALFHGMDFRPMLSSHPYTWGSFFYAVIVLGLWGFGIGAFFAWMQRLMSGKRLQG